MRCLCHREGRYILSPQNNVDEASGDQLITLICDTTGVDVRGEWDYSIQYGGSF
jgi:hypothetical protein